MFESVKEHIVVIKKQQIYLVYLANYYYHKINTFEAQIQKEYRTERDICCKNKDIIIVQKTKTLLL